MASAHLSTTPSAQDPSSNVWNLYYKELGTLKSSPEQVVGHFNSLPNRKQVAVLTTGNKKPPSQRVLIECEHFDKTSNVFGRMLAHFLKQFPKELAIGPSFERVRSEVVEALELNRIFKSEGELNASGDYISLQRKRIAEGKFTIVTTGYDSGGQKQRDFVFVFYKGRMVTCERLPGKSEPDRGTFSFFQVVPERFTEAHLKEFYAARFFDDKKVQSLMTKASKEFLKPEDELTQATSKSLSHKAQTVKNDRLVNLKAAAYRLPFFLFNLENDKPVGAVAKLAKKQSKLLATFARFKLLTDARETTLLEKSVFEDASRKMLKHLYRHPKLLAYCLQNESVKASWLELDFSQAVGFKEEDLASFSKIFPEVVKLVLPSGSSGEDRRLALRAQVVWGQNIRVEFIRKQKEEKASEASKSVVESKPQEASPVAQTNDEGKQDGDEDDDYVVV